MTKGWETVVGMEAQEQDYGACCLCAQRERSRGWVTGRGHARATPGGERRGQDLSLSSRRGVSAVSQPSYGADSGLGSCAGG